jgi:hypothetical protein
MNIANGNIVKIPLSNHEFALGKVIHISHVFKYCVIIGIYGFKYTNQNISELPQEYIEIISTSIEAFNKKWKWEIIGNAPISLEDKEKTKRIIAGDIWIEDSLLRKAEEIDYITIRKEIALGISLAQIRIEEKLKKT